MSRTICWVPEWSESHPGLGLEHLILRDGAASSVLLAFDDEAGPFRLAYELRWGPFWQLREADLSIVAADSIHSLHLRTDGLGTWMDGDGRRIGLLDGCHDIDIWPTPFTNSFPIRRQGLALGERQEFRVAWIAAPELQVTPQVQAYTRIGERLYRFESLDGSGFTVDLPVDADGIVLDYPGLFRRAY